jgi:hypothetical protein
MQSSPASCNFLPLRSKYSSHHPVLKHPPYVISVGFWLGCINIERLVLLDFIHIVWCLKNKKKLWFFVYNF